MLIQVLIQNYKFMRKNIYKNFKSLTILVLSAFPVVSFAALNGLKGLLGDFGQILGLAQPLIFGIAFLYFFWGVAQFILNAGEQKARDEGKKKMLWGIVALFVMISIVGILHTVGYLIGIPVGNGIPGFQQGPF
jgi:hypothetical protein